MPFFEWLAATSISMWLQESTYTFPIVEVVHLFGLTILLGSTSIVCLRLWGFGMQRSPLELYRGLASWTWLGLVLVFGSGLTLLIAEPVKMAENPAFAYKLAFLSGGLLFHFLGYLRIMKSGQAESSTMTAKLVAAGVMVCWFGAGIMGRAIGFV